MKASEAPAFLLERRTLASGKTLAPLKTVRKRAKHQAIRVEGDTGRPAMKRQRRITKEMRDRSSTGHATSIGARRSSVPHDRYKLRELLDPDDDWRNLMLWEGVGSSARVSRHRAWRRRCAQASRRA
jgi:hypothetical protein